VATDNETGDGVGPKTLPERSEIEDSPAESSADLTAENACEGKSLVILQVNCRSIYQKVLEFWNLIETYYPDVIIGTESWLHEEISNAEVFRGDYITFRRDGCSVIVLENGQITAVA
jgi:hypothetical protein